jgi:threonine aldolase
MHSYNITGISEKVLQAIVRENNGEALAYGDDDLTALSKKKYREFLEKMA